jgi:hypothetical protein
LTINCHSTALIVSKFLIGKGRLKDCHSTSPFYVLGRVNSDAGAKSSTADASKKTIMLAYFLGDR